MYYFHFGLIFFLVFRIGAVLKWFSMPAFWNQGTISGGQIRYLVKRDKKQKSIESVFLAIDVPDKVRFRAHGETGFDRFAKQLGFAREFQAKDAQFDNALYLVSDDQVLLDVLTADKRFRTSLIECIYGSRYIECSNGRLIVEMGNRGFDFSKEDVDVAESAAQYVMKAMQDIRGRIDACQAELWSARRDPRAQVQSFVFSIMVALGIGAALAYLWQLFDHSGDQVVYENILKYELIAGFVAVGALALLLIVALRFCSRTHLVLLEVLLVGLPSALLIANTYFDWSNKVYDKSDPKPIHVTASDKVITKGRKGSKNHFLTIRNWPDSRVDMRYRVTESVFNSVNPGDCIRVIWHDGYYRDPWISGLTPLGSSCSD